jgi:putative PIN family toxin of toxin-antitoxin system
MVQGKKLKAVRVVLDTNCLLSALLFSHGRLAWLRVAWQDRRFIPLVSRETARELIRVLNYPKFKLDREEQELLLMDFLPFAETVLIHTIPEGLPALRDPDDMMFLMLAKAANAHALVSGDADILALGDRLGETCILPVGEFAEWLDKQGNRA